MQPYLNRFSVTKRAFVPEPDADDVELHRKRQRNDLRLKSTFDSIVERYSRDFSEVGDEIDLHTGEVVVDNGHLLHMDNELDTGLIEAGGARPLRRQTEMVNRMAADEQEYISEQEYEDGYDQAESDEGVEDDEDELGSDWPVGTPAKTLTSQKAYNRGPSPASSLDSALDEWAEFEDATATNNGGVGGSMPQVHEPQFPMPPTGLPIAFDTAFKTMTAAFQSSMMALMGAALNQNSAMTLPTQPMNFPQPQPPYLTPSVARAFPKSSNPAISERKRRTLDSHSIPTAPIQSVPAARTPTIAGYTRESTPNSPSLWAAVPKLKRGRPRKVPLPTVETIPTRKAPGLSALRNVVSTSSPDPKRSTLSSLIPADEGDELSYVESRPISKDQRSAMNAASKFSQENPASASDSPSFPIRTSSIQWEQRSPDSPPFDMSNTPPKEHSPDVTIIADSEEDEIDVITPAKGSHDSASQGVHRVSNAGARGAEPIVLIITPPHNSSCTHCSTNKPPKWRSADMNLCDGCFMNSKAHKGRMRPRNLSLPLDVTCSQCGERTSASIAISANARLCPQCHDDLFGISELQQTHRSTNGADPAVSQTPMVRERLSIEDRHDYEYSGDRSDDSSGPEHDSAPTSSKLTPQSSSPFATVTPRRLEGRRQKRMGGIPNKQGKPCKWCNAVLSCRWRPAQDGLDSQICEACYRDIVKQMNHADSGDCTEPKPKERKISNPVEGHCEWCQLTETYRNWRRGPDGSTICTSCYYHSLHIRNKESVRWARIMPSGNLNMHLYKDKENGEWKIQIRPWSKSLG